MVYCFFFIAFFFCWVCVFLQPGISSSQSSPAVGTVSSSNQERFYIHPRARSNEGIGVSSSAPKISNYDSREQQHHPASSSSSSSSPKVASGRKGISPAVGNYQQIRGPRPHRANKPYRTNRSRSNTDVKHADGRTVADSHVTVPQTCPLPSPPLP